MGSLSSSLKSGSDPSAGGRLETRGFGQNPEPLTFPSSPKRERSTSDLARMIESEIIPRLMLAHGAAVREREAPPAQGGVNARSLDVFARMAATSDTATLVAFVEALMRGGLSLEAVYVDLLIPTARRLGDDWVDDSISFTDVTLGLSRMQQVVRTLGWKAPATGGGGDVRTAYFIPSPGEQHTFGLFIIEDCFRRAGWRTWLDAAATLDQAKDAVREERFDLFGLSASSDASAATIAQSIAEIRRASKNPDIFIMAGGRLFAEQPGLAAEVGADATALTERDALLIADKAIRPTAFG